MRSQSAMQGAAVILDPRSAPSWPWPAFPATTQTDSCLDSPRVTARCCSPRRSDRSCRGQRRVSIRPDPPSSRLPSPPRWKDWATPRRQCSTAPRPFNSKGRQVWEDWTVAYGVGAQGPLTLHQALVNSCNTIFYGIGRELDAMDPDYLPRMAKAFGLGAPTGIPYLPEAAGAAPDPAWKLETFGDYWATGDAVNLAIGQGFLQVTPLQLATAYAAIANGAISCSPTSSPNWSTPRVRRSRLASGSCAGGQSPGPRSPRCRRHCGPRPATPTERDRTGFSAT